MKGAVQKICGRNSLSFYSKKRDVRASARRHHLSLEDAGRRERYLFFQSAAKKCGASKIVTAHTLDDQVETVLMRILRGSGSKGLAGIPFKRPLGSFTLLRPLLSSSKKDLLALVKEMKLEVVEDPSNLDFSFLRNRIRHQLLPLLRSRFNPQIDEQLSTLQTLSRDAQNCVDTLAERSYKNCVRSQSRVRVSLSAPALKKLPQAVRSRILFMALSRLKGDAAGFGYAHIQSMLEVAFSPNARAETHLPHGLRARKKGGSLVIH